MFGFVPRPMTGDPASEMEAFVDIGAKPVKTCLAPLNEIDARLESHNASKLLAEGFEVGRVVGRKGANFIVQIGDERREVPPTDIKRVLG